LRHVAQKVWQGLHCAGSCAQNGRMVYRRRHEDHRQKAVKTATDAWYATTKGSAWAQPADVKAAFGTASILKDNRAVFNLCGNKYRLVVKINYVKAIVYIRFVGSHHDYDAIDAGKV
jgi:mRNA interferase HigB